MADFDRHLVSAWDMSNINPSDIGWKGNDNHGVGSGLVAATDIVEGVAGRKCVEFDGTNQYVQLPLAAANFMNGQTAFSVALWFLANAAGGRLFDFRDGINDGVILNYTAGAAVDLFYNAIGASSPVIAFGTWTHAVGVKHAAGIQELYIDGAFVDSDDSSAQTIDVTTPPRIGIDSYDLNGDYNGRIDDVRIYDAALTSLQIAELYNASRQGRN